MRLGRGRECTVKKARIEAKERTYSEKDLDFWGVSLDVALIVGYKDVVVSATGFHGQLTGEVRSRGIVARNSTDEGGAV